jgi:hypothetical protein
MVHDWEGSCEPIVCAADHCLTASRVGGNGGSSTPTLLELVPLERGLIAFTAAGLFLCAEADGRITLSRALCSLWECFLASEGWCLDVPGGGEEQLGEMPIDWPAIRSFRAGTVQTPVSKQVALVSTPPGGAGSRFSRRRVLVIRHRGNLGNKMLQYMGALTLASRIKDCKIVNVSIPEWGIEIPDDTQDELFFDNEDLWVWDAFRPHVEELCAVANRSLSIRIMMGDHLQRMEFLMSPRFYDSIFPKGSVLTHRLTEKDLVINIRTGEILNGVPHYPILPISFYEDVVSKTGLNPVFVGQLNPSEYVQQLRSRFSGARFIDSQGARADFDLIRSAKNIVVAVSTFSWLAAWLSEAKTIILPLSGFLNPAHHREIDLLPVDDVRYRFFLFPLNYGLPEKESIEHHERMRGYWEEISRNQAALLKSASPFLRVPRENYDSGLPRRSAGASTITFDPVWYAHQYIDAAMEISEGWFEDPFHHYLEVGRLRGYLPTRPVQDEVPLDLAWANLALGKRATQSSLSQWSKGATLEEDAGYAVSGAPSRDGFHTNEDANPWWMVDLGSTAQVHLIRIFNRERIPDWIQQRANPLVVEVSNDGEQWATLFRTERGQVFGGYSGGRPLVWSTKQPVEARFVRVSIPRQEYLHLAEIEIYGLKIITELADNIKVEEDSTIEAGLARVDDALGQVRRKHSTNLGQDGSNLETAPSASYQSMLNMLGEAIPDPFFLEVGAMDGASLDPLFATARRLSWRGMLIEPLRDLFDRLRANYENVRRPEEVRAGA